MGLILSSEQFELLAVFQMTRPVRIAGRFIQPGQDVGADIVLARESTLWYEVGAIAGFRDRQSLCTSQLDMTVAGVQSVGLIADLDVALAPDQCEGVIAVGHG